jgi:hypothetical protein
VRYCAAFLFYFGLFCIISVYVGGKKNSVARFTCGKSKKSVAKKFLAFARALGRIYTRVNSSVWRHSRKLDLYELATVTPVLFLSSYGNYFSSKNSGEQQKLYGNPVHIHLFTSKTDIEMRGQKCNRKVQGSNMLALIMG